MLKYVLVGLCISAGYIIEGTVGFGATVIALPLVTALIGIKQAVSVLSCISCFASFFIFIRDVKRVNVREYLKIVGIMCIGLPLGMYMFSFMEEKPLRVLLGVFMIIVSIRGFYSEKVKTHIAVNGPEEKNKNDKLVRVLKHFIVFLGGIIQGAFTCGGPFVIIYASDAIKEKTEFRATLALVWFTMNIFIVLKNCLIGFVTEYVLINVAAALPLLIITLVLTNILHKKINGDSFVKVVYGALLVAGIFMFV